MVTLSIVSPIYKGEKMLAELVSRITAAVTPITPNLPNTDRYTDCLLRLPMFYELTLDQVDYIVNEIQDFLQTLTNYDRTQNFQDLFPEERSRYLILPSSCLD